MDQVDLWASAVLRYAVNGLVGSARWAALGALADLLTEPPAEGVLGSVFLGVFCVFLCVHSCV